MVELWDEPILESSPIVTCNILTATRLYIDSICKKRYVDEDSSYIMTVIIGDYMSTVTKCLSARTLARRR